MPEIKHYPNGREHIANLWSRKWPESHADYLKGEPANVALITSHEVWRMDILENLHHVVKANGGSFSSSGISSGAINLNFVPHYSLNHLRGRRYSAIIIHEKFLYFSEQVYEVIVPALLPDADMEIVAFNPTMPMYEFP